MLSTYSFQFLHLKRIQISLFPTYLKTVLKYLHSWIRSIISQWMFFFIMLRRTDVDLCLLSTESKERKPLSFELFFCLLWLVTTHSSLLDLSLRPSVADILKVRSMLHTSVTIFLVIFQASEMVELSWIIDKCW